MQVIIQFKNSYTTHVDIYTYVCVRTCVYIHTYIAFAMALQPIPP